jgi:hypothetical protein
MSQRDAERRGWLACREAALVVIRSYLRNAMDSRSVLEAVESELGKLEPSRDEKT